MIISCLRDLIKNVNNLKIGVVKLTGDSDGNIKIQAVEGNNKSVVVTGKFSKKVPEFEGIIGLSELGTLEKLVNAFSEPNDTIEIVREDRTVEEEVIGDDGKIEYDDNGNPVIVKKTENIIVGFNFRRPSPKIFQPYRTMDQRIIPQQFDPKKITWDITFKPSKPAVDALTMVSGFGLAPVFSAELRGTDLYLLLNGAEVEFAKNITGTLTKKWEWDVNNVAALLRRSESADCELKIFNDKGAIGVALDSGVAKYEFILPAKAGK